MSFEMVPSLWFVLAVGFFGFYCWVDHRNTKIVSYADRVLPWLSLFMTLFGILVIAHAWISQSTVHTLYVMCTMVLGVMIVFAAAFIAHVWWKAQSPDYG